jgi:hypothetical protein
VTNQPQSAHIIDTKKSKNVGKEITAKKAKVKEDEVPRKVEIQ